MDVSVGSVGVTSVTVAVAFWLESYIDVAVMVAVVPLAGAVKFPLPSIVPPPVTDQVKSVHSGLELLSQSPLITAPGGTPVTDVLGLNENCSLKPIVNVEGTMLTRTPESSVTAAVAVALVPVVESATLTVTVMLVFAGTMGGA